MADIVMPRLSDSMEEGTILRWLKQVGDEVAVGDEVVEIETDKANMTYESDVAGTITEILAAEDETLPIGAPIARVDGNGTEQGEASAEGTMREAAGPVAEGDPPANPPEGRPSTPPAEDESGSTAAPAAEQAPAARDQTGAAQADGRPKASPLARRIAKERGVDLTQLKGSGPGGRIVKSDVEGVEAGKGPSVAAEPAEAPAAATPGVGEKPETAKGEAERVEPSKLQQTVARRMAESKATAPHFYLQTEVDMSRAVEARARLKEIAAEGEVVPSFNDMVVKACALALRETPRANAAYRDGAFELYSRVNVGVAVAAREALVVPTVFDADRKGLRQIATEARALAERVRSGEITPPELSGATFTVSNLGMYGTDSFAAVINPPQAAILAVGAISERPVVRDGTLAPGHTMWLNLACDHRILYGAEGAEFLAQIRALLEEPLLLAL